VYYCFLCIVLFCSRRVTCAGECVLCSRTSKGFSGQQTVKLNGCTEVYVETLKVFLHALNMPVQRPTLHQGVRQFLHRMVVCLDTDILPFIPVAMHCLLEHADVRELYDFIPFVNQVIQKFKVRYYYK